MAPSVTHPLPAEGALFGGALHGRACPSFRTLFVSMPITSLVTPAGQGLFTAITATCRQSGSSGFIGGFKFRKISYHRIPSTSQKFKGGGAWVQRTCTGRYIIRHLVVLQDHNTLTARRRKDLERGSF